MSLATGTRLGPYIVDAPIGAGGMGEVYRATDTRLARRVAVKVLPRSFTGDADRRARFEREAQAVAALSHPNIIAIFDTGLHEDHAFVVMELLEGQTLRTRLESGLVPVRKACDMAVQIARGLGAAHAKGIVHRDLKPENVFLLDDGQVKILDFGLALQSSARDSGAMQTIAATEPGTVMGTVGYMAPEQVRGQAVDARADLFAFGAVLYEMVTGQRAFQRDTAADTMSAILSADPPELVHSRPDLPPALERIIRHCLEKNANERFQSARDVAFALDALTGPASGPAPTVAAADGARTHRARPRLGIAAAVAAALAVGAAAGYLGAGRQPRSAGAADVVYKPVTFEEGFVFAARFAPDGRTIVYSADWDREPRGVYVTSLDSPEYRPLGFPGADLLGISRTGELAILSGSRVAAGNPYWRLGTLARASMTGGAPRAELEDVNFADIGPDNTMAVVRGTAKRRTIEYPAGRVLAEVPFIKNQSWLSSGEFATPRVSPSGDYVAFFDISVASAFRVRVFDRAGKLVAESRPFLDWWSLAWTPANELWFAAAETVGRQTAIFSLDLRGRERMVFRAPGAVTLHDISSAGAVLVSFDRGRTHLEMLDGSSATPIDRSWREESRVDALSSSHALLFEEAGDSGGPQGSVYVWQPKEAQPVRIASGSGLALSTDGSKALVVSPDVPPKLSIVPTGAGQPQAVDLGPVASISWAGWLPDGRVVAQVASSGSTPMIRLLSATGGEGRPLAPAGTTLVGDNLISPDGSRIVAVDAEGQLMVCTVAAPGCQPLSGRRPGDVVCGWTADGRSVFVYRPRPDGVDVERIDVASGLRSPWKTVRPRTAAISGVGRLIAAPDGTLAYGYARNASQLYVIKGLK